jgi:type IV secretion system protein VirB5
MRLFRNKRQAALSTAPGMYAEEDPSTVIFETSTKLKIEKNRWVLMSFVMGSIAAGAVWTRQPPPSVTRVVGVSADVSGHPVVTELVSYKPDSQATRTSMKDMVVRWFTIEPVLTDSLQTSRMSANINSVKAQMIGAAADQFKSWLRDDAPFQQITANPKLIREVNVRNIALLEDQTVLVEFTTTTSQAGLTANPFGIYVPFFRLERTGGA